MAGWAVGWSLAGASYIERASPGKGAPSWDNTSDIFLLDGQQLLRCTEGVQSPSCPYPASAGYTAYTTKVESFQRIARDEEGQRWYIWSKTGVKSTYTPHLTTARGIYSWHLERVEDLSGNAVTYSNPT